MCKPASLILLPCRPPPPTPPTHSLPETGAQPAVDHSSVVDGGGPAPGQGRAHHRCIRRFQVSTAPRPPTLSSCPLPPATAAQADGSPCCSRLALRLSPRGAEGRRTAWFFVDKEEVAVFVDIEDDGGDLDWWPVRAQELLESASSTVLNGFWLWAGVTLLDNARVRIVPTERAELGGAPPAQQDVPDPAPAVEPEPEPVAAAADPEPESGA
eukprot:COSAG04_NODE_3218_length_3034_cov_725.639182_2_plen_212_part_00